MAEERCGARYLTRHPAKKTAAALAASQQLCSTASVCLTHADAPVDQSREAVARSPLRIVSAAHRASRCNGWSGLALNKKIGLTGQWPDYWVKLTPMRNRTAVLT
jgi:hypothetical protein